MYMLIRTKQHDYPVCLPYKIGLSKILVGLISYLLLMFVCYAQTVTVTGNIPYAKDLIKPDGSLDAWAIPRIRQDKNYTVNPIEGKASVMDRDNNSRGDQLGDRSFIPNETKSYSGTLDLTETAFSSSIAILVDDNATLTITEIERAEGVSGPVFSEPPYKVIGTALWNPKSYKEFTTPLPPGRKYQLDLVYTNNANLTEQYNGKIDVDGVSVYVSIVPGDLENISFQGPETDHTELVPDKGVGVYAAPHWIKADPKKYDPVSYVKKKQPEISAQFLIPNIPTTPAPNIQAKGTDGVNIPSTPLTYNKDKGIWELPKTAASAFPDFIKYYNLNDPTKDFKFEWQISFDGGGKWFDFAETKHAIYVTAAKPTCALMQHSLFYFACNKPNGLNGDAPNEGTIVEKIYEEFKKTVTKKTMNKLDDVTGLPEATALRFDSPPPAGVPSGDILKLGSDNCGGWAKFLGEILKVHGYQSDLVKINSLNIIFSDGYAHNGSAWFVKGADQTKPLGANTLGQGGGSSQNSWPGHEITKAYGKYYEPSYGLGPYLDEAEYENQTVGSYFYTYQGGLFNKEQIEYE